MLDESVAGRITRSYQYSPFGQRLSQVVHNTDGTTEDGLTMTVAGTTVTVTSKHPFYVPGRGWVTSGKLKPGDHLLQRDGTTTTTITAITYSDATTTVYTFEVEGDHNYYISQAQLLVHNCGIDANDLKLSSTVAAHTHDLTKQGTPARPFNEWRLTMQEIMRGSTPRPDPGGVPGGLRWDTPGALNGKQGTWELVVDTKTNTVLHYNFTTR